MYFRIPPLWNCLIFHKIKCRLGLNPRVKTFVFQDLYFTFYGFFMFELYYPSHWETSLFLRWTTVSNLTVYFGRHVFGYSTCKRETTRRAIEIHYKRDPVEQSRANIYVIEHFVVINLRKSCNYLRRLITSRSTIKFFKLTSNEM